jgi:hypothetical protein
MHCFLGIAQNTVASAGSVVCVAVPGMIDRSCFGTRFFTSCPYGSTLGLGACSNCFGCITTVTNCFFGEGLAGAASASFCNYPCQYVTLQRLYDCYSNSALTMIGLRFNCLNGGF